jgi:dTDP-4-amino-4,6-dideoxygalactose transaminase
MEGINSRLDGLQAAILLAKLPYLQSWTDSRRRVAQQYSGLLHGIEMIEIPTVGLHRDHVYHLYVIRTDHREQLKRHLAAAGVATTLNYPKALPFCPAYSYLNHLESDFPVAYANQSRILSLPIYPELSSAMISQVCDHIANFFGERTVGAAGCGKPASRACPHA